MKAITEFPNFTLSRALKVKTDLTAEGKSAEEIQASLGQSFKLEGEKLSYFMHAIDLAGQNSQNLKRIMVVSFNEGENIPPKATKLDEMYYIPEMLVEARAAASAPNDRRGGGRGGKGGGRNDRKGSPWGLSPEEKAAKGSKAPAEKAKS